MAGCEDPITITGGHGGFRSRGDLPRQLGGPLTRMEILGGSMVADSPDEVRVRAREQLSLGASQVKLTAGGGVASAHSPLDVATFNEDELRAAVQAAATASSPPPLAWMCLVGHASFTVNGRRRCRGVMGPYYGQQLQSLRVEPARQRIAERLTPPG